MRIKLRQAFDLQMGKTPARNRPDYWNGDHKWISIADIGNAGKFLTKTKESITKAGIDGSGIKVVPQGTVIMSFKLSIGKTAITSEDMYTNEAIMAFIDNGKFAVDTDYLYHLCCGTNWTAGTNKAVMGLTLNKATLLEKEIPLPDINEQHEIATKLDKIDAIIAERQQQLELIDQAVKSRFIELFGEPELNPRDLPVLPWGAVFQTTTGKLDSNAMVENGRYPFFTCAKESYKIDSYAFDCEALLLAGNNAAGIYDVKHYKGKFNAYQRTYVLRLMNEKWSYILFKRQLEDKLRYLQSQSKGTNTRYLTLGILNELRFVVPQSLSRSSLRPSSNRPTNQNFSMRWRWRHETVLPVEHIPY